MEHPIPLAELKPDLHKFCDPSGPVPGRMMAAKGLVPLGPTDLLTVLYQLSHDPDPQVAAAASEKSVQLPENIVSGALAEMADPRVLDFYADKLTNNDPLLQVILLNQSAADETVGRLSKKVSEMLCEVIATNEQRLLRYPRIIEGLYNNKQARMSTVNRAIELAVRNGIILDGIAAFKEVAAAIQGELIVDEEGPTPMDQAFSSALSLGEALSLDANDDPDAIDEAEDGTPLGEQKNNLQFMVSKMSISEKIRTAMLGTPAHRALLVRDTNKMVAMAAIKAPSVNDQEIEAYTRNRGMAEEVIRYISGQREWTKSYRVKLNLVQNPKTPLPKALSFLVHMRSGDLRTISRSKNVPQAIAQAARQQERKRTQR